MTNPIKDFVTDIVEEMAALLTLYRRHPALEADIDAQLDQLYRQAYDQMEPYFPPRLTAPQRADLLCRVLDRRLTEWLAAFCGRMLH